MKDYLLDTNIAGLYAEYRLGLDESKTKAVKSHIDKINSDAKISFCSITVGEMEYGLRVANNGYKPDIERLCKFIFTHSIYQINNNVAKYYYSDLRAKLFAKYSPKTSRTRYHKLWQWRDPIDESALGVQENDLWIASVAINYNLILVTADNMDRINSVLNGELEIENWSIPL